MEGWYLVCVRIELCGVLVVCLALMFICIRECLESKPWEYRYVFGVMFVVVDALTSSPVLHGDWLTPLCPDLRTKSVVVFLCSLPGVG